MGITVKVRVKLFGLLPGRFPGYNSKQGLEIELAERAKVKDLLARLELSQLRMVVVTMDGLALKGDSELKNGSDVYVYNSIAGG